MNTKTASDKMAFAVEEGEDLDALVAVHFGKAAGFVILEGDSFTYHPAACPPTEPRSGVKRADQLISERITHLFVGGMGKVPQEIFARSRINVVRGLKETVRENLAMFEQGILGKSHICYTAHCEGCNR